MIALQVDVLVNNGGNNATAFFLFAKFTTNTFFALMVQTLKRLAGLILHTRGQSGRASLDDNEQESWKSDKFNKLDIT